MNYLKKKKSLIASYSNFKEYLKHKVVCFYISQESELKRGTAHVGISIIYKQYIYIYIFLNHNLNIDLVVRIIVCFFSFFSYKFGSGWQLWQLRGRFHCPRDPDGGISCVNFFLHCWSVSLTGALFSMRESQNGGNQFFFFFVLCIFSGICTVYTYVTGGKLMSVMFL